MHTHSRALHYHPHIHAVIPAAAIDKDHRLWREKPGKYLFNHKALAKVFCAKLLEAIVGDKLKLPGGCPKQWVVDCTSVGSGQRVLVYLGQYLYRGVIQEKNILSCRDGKVTFRYLDSKTKRYQNKTVSGAHFLWLVLQHVLPKGFRRARNDGFLHPNSKLLIRLLTLVLHLGGCPRIGIVTIPILGQSPRPGTISKKTKTSFSADLRVLWQADADR